MFDENLIVLIAFIIFMFLALRYGSKKATSFIDEQINDIKKILDQAEISFLSAQNKFKTEKENQTNLSAQIIQLMDKTDEQIHYIKQQSMTDLNLLLESKQLIVDSMIDQSRSKIIQELQSKLTQDIHAVLSELMTHHLDNELHESINENAIKRLEQIMNNAQSQSDSLDDRPVEKKMMRL